MEIEQFMLQHPAAFRLLGYQVFRKDGKKQVKVDKPFSIRESAEKYVELLKKANPKWELRIERLIAEKK